jgi:hypothetical protein
MAKGKPVKEASTAVIVWAVFMTLLAIGLGVFVYVLYSDQDKINADMAKAASDLKNARTGEAEAQQVALVYRVAMGIPEGDDLEKAALIKEGDKGFQELKKINDAVKNRLPKLYETQVAKVDDAFAQFYRAAAQANPMPPKLDVTTLLNEPANFWPAETDDRKQLKPPTAGTGLLQLAVKDRIFRDLSLALAVNDRKGYEDAVARLDTSAKSYGDARTAFTKKAADLPNEFKNKLDEINKQSDQRRDTYQRDQAETRKEVAKLTERIETAETEKQALDRVIRQLKEQQAAFLATQKQADPFQYDAPQGKITARPSDELVEINLGSNAAVTPGLTFTVLPSDFPQKGRQSRMKMLRLPDERGQYRNVETFVPKATIEVVEVIGPDVSRARVTSEDSPVRDRALPGDLLYNSVWRKGHADHIALAGIFDTNGDGTDDIEAVVRDLTKMGIPVDAYFDLKAKKWVGKLTDRTRYMVSGYTPIPGPGDANLDAKTKLIGAITGAKDEARNRNITVIDFRDFFGRTGYRVKLDVPEDRINQAASKYLGGVGTADMPPEGN